MKILHIGKYYWPTRGGIESVTKSLAEGAVGSGHVVTVVCFAKNEPPGSGLICGVNVIRCSSLFTFMSQAVSLVYVYSVFKSAKNADLIHLHLPNILGLLIMLFWARKKKLVIHWHSDIVGKFFFRVLLSPLQLLILYRADSIIATSKYYVNGSFFLSLFKKKIVVIPIGVEDKILNLSIGEKKSLIPKRFSDDRCLVLSVGRLVSYKGFEYLIDAANFLSDGISIVIVGGGPLQDELQARIIDSKLEAIVHLTGPLSDDELKLMFDTATMFCMSSINNAEAFGVVLLEAMTYGLPLIATNIPGSGVPWVNANNISGFNVAVKNPIEIANAINKIYKNKELHSMLSSGSRLRYVNNFTEELFVERVMMLYGSISSTI